MSDQLEFTGDVVEWTAIAEDPEKKKADEKVSVLAPANSTLLSLVGIFEGRYPNKKFCECNIKRADYVPPVVTGGFSSPLLDMIRPD
jgi:hypothetical protein